MNKVVIWVSLCLWVINSLLFIRKEILRNKNNKKNGIFHLIRFDAILFLLIYLFYQHFADNIPFPYLYIAIMVTSIVYILYDIGDNYKKERVGKIKYLYYLIYFVIAIILGIVYKWTDKYMMVTTISLIINCLIPLFVWLIYYVKDKEK